MDNWKNPISDIDKQVMDPDALALLKHFKFERLPVESTFYKNTYRSDLKMDDEVPLSTAMVGMFCINPLSVSCFHRLLYDEIWHVYGGDPFELILLFPDGSSKNILMGTNVLNGENIQFIVPANTWQAGSLVPGGRYALFGCTMATGFSGKCFEAAVVKELIAQYPDRTCDIIRLSVNGNETKMPEGFTQ